MNIKNLHLMGFKNYRKYTRFAFNDKMNILIGDNGVGKSTVLQAIETVLRIKNSGAYSDETKFANYINIQDKLDFEQNENLWSNFEKLPRIVIVVELNIDASLPKYMKFNGNYHPRITDDWKLGDTGIVFEYKFDEDYSSEYLEYVNSVRELPDNNYTIPFDFYKAEWKTFGMEYFKVNQDPLKSIIIDNSNWAGDPFNAFARQLFKTYDIKNQKSMRTSFRTKVIDLFENDENSSKAKYKLRINPNITKLESILDVSDSDQISIRHLGSGTENRIKTKLALENESSDLVLIEEPENHLSSANTRSQITDIQNSQENAQLILTTHNSQIVTKLGIKNIIWLKELDAITPLKFNNLSSKTQNFFNRKDDMNFLSLINFEYTILVEGAAEYILMETFVKKILEHDYDSLSSKIEVISYEGRYYQPFAELAETTGGKTLILTDNDGDANRIEEISKFNLKHDNTHIYSGKDIVNGWTFEACIYKENVEYIDAEKLFTKRPKKNKEYPDRPARLNYMLNNKTDVALEMISKFEEKNDSPQLY